MNVGIVSLGCAKNQVDLEEIIGYLKMNGFETVSDPSLADVILINTCGFILSAKEESIKAIFDMAEYGKPLIVTGCLATRYFEELKKEIPSVDLFVPLSEYKNFGELFSKFIEKKNFIGEISPLNRSLISDKGEAYLRISDGCNNYCTFCAIPLIRGPFKSVPFETLQKELDILENQGIKSLTLVSQDTSMYGKDIGTSLTDLVNEIVTKHHFEFVKIMYLYPDEVDDSLIELFKNNSNLTPYFDLPVQHFSDKILKRMGRRGTSLDTENLIKRFRREVPNSIIRTTVMVGFPNETDEDFEILKSKIKELEFDHLGCFMYCREEGTPSYKYKGQIDEDTKVKRYNEIMKLQKRISLKLNKNRIGQIYKCMVKDYDPNTFSYNCVSNIYAPDDIDGKMQLFSKRELKTGEIVNAKVVNALVYDLQAEVVD